MKIVNQQVVKQIEDVAERLQISKREAAQAVRDNFLKDELTNSVAQVDMYLNALKESA